MGSISCYKNAPFFLKFFEYLEENKYETIDSNY